MLVTPRSSYSSYNVLATSSHIKVREIGGTCREKNGDRLAHTHTPTASGQQALAASIKFRKQKKTPTAPSPNGYHRFKYQKQKFIDSVHNTRLKRFLTDTYRLRQLYAQKLSKKIVSVNRTTILADLAEYANVIKLDDHTLATNLHVHYNVANAANVVFCKKNSIILYFLF